MDGNGFGSVVRDRRFESYLDAKDRCNMEAVGSNAVEQQVSVMRESNGHNLDNDYDNVDDDGWVSLCINSLRVVAAFITMLSTTILWVVILIVLIPWPYERIKLGNLWGHVTGRLLLWILQNPLKIEGHENAYRRAIFVSNHASIFDVFLMMWLTPIGTVGIAKKEV